MSSTPDDAKRDPERPWRLFILAASMASIVCTHAPLIGYRTFANVDEAYASALAERLLEGQKLYQGAVSQRGPLMYYAFELLAWLHGWDNIVALRAWGLALAIAHLLLVYWAGRALLSKTAATVATAAAGYALSFGFPPSDGVAINGESLQLPALLVALVLGARAMRCVPGTRSRAVHLLGAGALFGIAIAIKQSVALHPAVLVLWVVIDAHRRRSGKARAARDVLLLFGATLFVPTVLVVHSAASGTLRDLYYYCVVYNRDVHLRPTTKSFTWLPFLFFRLAEQTLFFIVGVLLFARALPLMVRRAKAAQRLRSLWALGRGFGARHYLALHVVLAIVAASSMFRFFPHYYLQAAPFMALALGASVDPLLRRPRTAWPARVMVSAFVFFTMFASALGCVFGERVDGRVAHDRTVQDAGKLIAATTKPDDKIFVWGFSPWLYEYSHRRPAGRYVFETYVTGFVPWFWEKLDVERARIVPGSVAALLGDLDRERPEIVVDAGSVMMARPMRAYDAPAAWLRASYCFEVRLGAFDMYRRKHDDTPCVTAFPRPHEAVDWMGRAMAIPLPRTVDFATSRLLPRGNFIKPLWFPTGPTPPGLDSIRDPRLEKEEAEAERDGFYIPRIEVDPLAPSP